jgi:hypothetical protein
MVEETGVPGEIIDLQNSLTNFIKQCCIKYISPWVGFKLTTLVLIDTACIGCYKSNYHTITSTTISRGRRGRDRMVVGFTTTYAISAYHHWCCEFKYPYGARCTTLYDKVCQWITTAQWVSPGPLVFSTKKTDCHDITEKIVESGIKTQ